MYDNISPLSIKHVEGRWIQLTWKLTINIILLIAVQVLHYT